MEYTSESIAELIFEIINYILSKLFTSIDKTIYSLLDSITFIDESLIDNENLKKIIGENSSSGIILICNALVLGFFIFYAIQFLLSHLTLKKIQKPSQFIFKAIIFIAIMNSSLWFCGEIIRIVSLITKAISLLSVDLFQTEISFSAFISNLNDILYETNDSIDIFSFDGIVKSFSSFGMLNLIFTYSLRYILIQIFVIISPFAFLTLILESTEKFFFSWIKNFISLLLIQILLAIILLLAFSFVSLQEPTMQKLMYIASIYAINKANYFMRELIGGIYFNVNANAQIANK
jgi:hypothetical protein